MSEGRGRGCVAMMMQQASTVSHIVRTLCSALCLHLAACVANHLSLLRSVGSEVGQSTLLSALSLSPCLYLCTLTLHKVSQCCGTICGHSSMGF